MAQEQILEGNKLIAEFMGLEVFEGRGILWTGDLSEETLDTVKYHSSWDELMPVVEKIEAIDNTEEFEVDIFSNCCDIGGNFEAVGKTKIEATYKAVVQFITWYNNQNK